MASTQLLAGSIQVPVDSMLLPEGSTQALRRVALIIPVSTQLLRLLVEEMTWPGEMVVLAELRLDLEDNLPGIFCFLRLTLGPVGELSDVSCRSLNFSLGFCFVASYLPATGSDEMYNSAR